MVSIMHAQTNGATNSTLNERVFPMIQMMATTLLMRDEEIETGTFTCHQGYGNKPDGSNKNLIKKKSRSAYNIRDEGRGGSGCLH